MARASDAGRKHRGGTYYGHELRDLPFRKITQFPYSWLAHPMLVGNIAAFAGTLINAEFRAQWWPLAMAHVALNVGLLLMEIAVHPLRRAARRSECFAEDTDVEFACPSDHHDAILSATIGIGAGLATALQRTGYWE